MNRGYNDTKIQEEINRAAALERNTLLTYKEKEPNTRIPLVVTYDQRLPEIKKILDEDWKLLQINQTESAKFLEKLLVCFKPNKNLRDILGQTRIKNGKVMRRREMKGRCTPCRGRSDAKCCRHMVNTNVFTDKSGKKRFNIRQRT